MDKDAKKAADDERRAKERRQQQDANFPGPERRVGDRRDTGSPSSD